jgi:hypothetical protein
MGLARWAGRCFAALSMTGWGRSVESEMLPLRCAQHDMAPSHALSRIGVDLAVGEDLSRSFAPCLPLIRPLSRSLSLTHLGHPCIERRAVRPGTHKGPAAPPYHPVPLHVRGLPRHQAMPDGRGSGDGQYVVARGVVGGGWALVWQESLGDSQPGANSPQNCRGES